MAKLLVVGASRGIGLETVNASLLAGHSVRALARSAASIPIQNPNLEKASGDALDTDMIRNDEAGCSPRDLAGQRPPAFQGVCEAL